MGNVSYAVNERVRRLLRILLIVLVVMLIISPFFIFSKYGTTKIHDWASRHPKSGMAPGLLYASARINCMMGALSDDRYETAQRYFEEFVVSHPAHKKMGYATFYIAWSLEEQGKRAKAKFAYQEFLLQYPDHDKAETARKALNRIEAFGPTYSRE